MTTNATKGGDPISEPQPLTDVELETVIAGGEFVVPLLGLIPAIISLVEWIWPRKKVKHR